MIHLSDAVLLITLIVTVIYLYLTKNFNYWKTRNVPFRKPIFLFGNLFDVVVKGKPIARYLANLCHEYNGPYFGFFGMNEPFLVVKDTSIIKRILVTDFQAFPEKTFINNESIDPIFANVLFTQNHQKWADLKSKLIPIFTSGKIKTMLSYIQENGNSMCGYLDANLNKEVNTTELASKYSTDVIANLAFGMHVNAFQEGKCEFREKGKRLFAPKLSRALQPLAYVFAHLLVKLLRLKFIETEAANYFRRVFNKTLQERERTKLRRNDLIDTLLDLKNRQTKNSVFQFAGDKLVAQAIIFYVAGHEGISSAVTLTLLELAVYPKLQDRLRKEIQDVLALHGDLTYDAIQDMKYLYMVISETFRKYPFTAFVHRRCTENYTIKETGLVLEKGLKILIPIQGLHWDPQFYPEPEVFNPDRFSDKNKSNRPEYCYIPFGGGPRGCIGNRFALLAIQLGLVQLLRNYKVKRGPNTKYPLEFSVSFFLNSTQGVSLIFSKV